MTLKTLEQIFIQLSFLIYFLVTLFSWIKIALYEEKKNQVKIDDQQAFSIILWKKPTSLGIALGFLSVSGLCLIRWNLSDHLPLSNLYESSLFFSWSLIFIYFMFRTNIDNEWLDAILAPIILMTTTFSTLGLPKQLQQATSLVPALQSNWLIMHVTMMILSYATLILGSLLAVTLCSITFFLNKNISKEISNAYYMSDQTKHVNFIENNSFIEPINEKEIDIQKSFYEKSRKIEQTKRKKTIPDSKTEPIYSLVTTFDSLKSAYLQKNRSLLINQIDYWSYRMIGIGFPMLTLGILSGAVWANEAWGSYWNWDPKETWALITWIIFAIYLHARIAKGWNGIKPASVAILGFFVVWVCYLGVNFLGKGLHSYGWLN
jgi:cytochrome c-type biogenesis protein CcsB